MPWDKCIEYQNRKLGYYQFSLNTEIKCKGTTKTAIHLEHKMTHRDYTSLSQQTLTRIQHEPHRANKTEPMQMTDTLQGKISLFWSSKWSDIIITCTQKSYMWPPPPVASCTFCDPLPLRMYK